MKALAVVALVFIASLVVCEESYSRDGYDYDGSRYVDDGEVVVINRPVNIQGLTGLLFTNSAYTQPAGNVTFGLSVLAEDSSVPNFSIVQGGATMTVGLADTLEIGVKGKMIDKNLGSSTTEEVGAGDTDLLIKWRFLSQGEFMPALAVGLAWKFPTADVTKGLSEVKYEGVTLMAIATSEKRVEDTVIGLYLEAQAVFNDQYHGQPRNTTADTSYMEKYGVVNAGLLVPISDDDHLQLMVEYNRVFKKDIETLYERNYSALTPGLRYVTENFNISVGVQRLNKEDTGSTAANDNRYVGTMSYKF